MRVGKKHLASLAGKHSRMPNGINGNRGKGSLLVGPSRWQRPRRMSNRRSAPVCSSQIRRVAAQCNSCVLLSSSSMMFWCSYVAPHSPAKPTASRTRLPQKKCRCASRLLASWQDSLPALFARLPAETEQLLNVPHAACPQTSVAPAPQQAQGRNLAWAATRSSACDECAFETHLSRLDPASRALLPQAGPHAISCSPCLHGIPHVPASRRAIGAPRPAAPTPPAPTFGFLPPKHAVLLT